MNNQNSIKRTSLSSLTTGENFLQKLIAKRKSEIEQTLSEEQKEEINYILNNCLNYHMRIYYFDNSLKHVEGKITKLDTRNNIISINTRNINIQKIKKIELR